MRWCVHVSVCQCVRVSVRTCVSVCARGCTSGCVCACGAEYLFMFRFLFMLLNLICICYLYDIPTFCVVIGTIFDTFTFLCFMKLICLRFIFVISTIYLRFM